MRDLSFTDRWPGRKLEVDGYVATFMVALSGFAGLTLLAVLPLWVSSLIDNGHYSPSSAGQVASFNLLGTAVGMIFLAWLIRRRSRVRIALAGIAILLIANLVSLFVDSLHGLMIVQGVGGAGAGLLAGTAYAWSAKQRFPERGYAMLLMMQFLGTGGLISLLADPVAAHGTEVIYLCLVGCSLVSLLGVPFMAHQTLPDGDAGDGKATSMLALFADWRVWSALLAIGLFELANGGVWAFMQPFGEHLISADTIQYVIALTGAVGAPGALAVMLLGPRFGHTKPLCIGLFGSLAAVALLLPLNSATTYILSTLLLNFLWAFTLPYLQGVLARMDPHGELTTIGGVVIMSSLSFGPSLIGFGIATGGLHLGLVVVMVAFAGCLAIALPTTWATRELDPSRRNV
ncbi:MULTISPECIES: MFS transporter [unclassified Modicisalibacter]|uniref:MFS transporter n=1 Tax=unclassified Modicisalibacter TaxID=2679913 RepID=UPI001CCD0F55|nr:MULTISPECIES: MFS transporter [unclassified Modicisalibacter]MBZ9557639.1 MFS transporter [Modicisalibacter sp. R2A 31.J]MBZ9573697.1 MFS transporter [Modicisalibacter sp. MOD 31.J]